MKTIKHRVVKNHIVTLLSAGLLFAVFSSAHALTVQVFTDTAHPVSVQGVSQDVTVTYYNLDQLQTLIGKMNAAIQGQAPLAAEFQAKQLLVQYKVTLDHAVTGINLIHHYQITSIPTIIFNQGAYQIVGQTNLTLAITEYKQWASEKK